MYKPCMAFWNLRRIEPADPVREPIMGVPSIDLEPVALFGCHGVVEGSIDPMGRRMTELLNTRQDVRINVPDATGTVRWESFPLGDVVAVAPPPHATDPARRVSRRRHRVVLQAGLYRIVGTAHLPPGPDIHAFLQRRPGWMPLTDCTIGTSEADYEVDVAIVNAAHIREVERLLGAV